jgi:cyclin-dependent kinase 8/11
MVERVKVTDKYTIIGFISSGTYGRVFKAKSRLVYDPLVGCVGAVGSGRGTDGRRDGREFAIKKFKPDKEGEAIAHYSGISQSAVREMAVFAQYQVNHG